MDNKMSYGKCQGCEYGSKGFKAGTREAVINCYLTGDQIKIKECPREAPEDQGGELQKSTPDQGVEITIIKRSRLHQATLKATGRAGCAQAAVNQALEALELAKKEL